MEENKALQRRIEELSQAQEDKPMKQLTDMEAAPEEPIGKQQQLEEEHDRCPEVEITRSHIEIKPEDRKDQLAEVCNPIQLFRSSASKCY